MKYTDIKLQTLQEKDLIFILEDNIRGGLSSVMGDRYVNLDDDNREILCIDANNLYGWIMSQMLLYDEIEMWHGLPDLFMNKIEENLETRRDSDIGSFVKVELKYPDKIKEKTKSSLLLLKVKYVVKMILVII